jgi:hypothetical protein
MCVVVHSSLDLVLVSFGNDRMLPNWELARAAHRQQE